MKFSLDGARLHGRFVLIRLKPRPGERGESWLLIKEHDAEERAGLDAAEMEAVPLPSRAAPAKPAAKRTASAKAAAKPARKPAKSAKPAKSIPAGAHAAPLPEAQAPMLASNADLPPQGAEWLSEVKFDGYRLIVRKDGDDIRVAHAQRPGLDAPPPAVAAAPRPRCRRIS